MVLCIKQLLSTKGRHDLKCRLKGGSRLDGKIPDQEQDGGMNSHQVSLKQVFRSIFISYS